MTEGRVCPSAYFISDAVGDSKVYQNIYTKFRGIEPVGSTVVAEISAGGSTVAF
jgi:hypothetical protein